MNAPRSRRAPARGRARSSLARRPIHACRVVLDGEIRAVAVDLSESPLAWLARRKGRDGQGLISPAQLAAGERLRADFTRAGLTPRVTTDWSGGGRGSAGAEGWTDVMIAAKRRMQAALRAVGPELSGTLLDVCCFLKGLEAVEQERGWPARTGRVVLCLALDRLAAHYGLGDAARGRERAAMRAWRDISGAAESSG